MGKYLYNSNSEFQNTLNRDYIHYSELSVNVYSDAFVIPYHCEKLKIDMLNGGGIWLIISWLWGCIMGAIETGKILMKK